LPSLAGINKILTWDDSGVSATIKVYQTHIRCRYNPSTRRAHTQANININIVENEALIKSVNRLKCFPQVIGMCPLQRMDFNTSPRCRTGKTLCPRPLRTARQPFPRADNYSSTPWFPVRVEQCRFYDTNFLLLKPLCLDLAQLPQYSRRTESLLKGTIRFTNLHKYRSSGLYLLQYITSGRGIVSGNRRVCYYFAHATPDW
jgi:hypothetical protein